MSADSLTLTVAVANDALAPTPMQQRQMTGWLQNRNGKAVTVKFSRPKESRTLQQNAFYWGTILTTIARETGHTPEEVHEVLKDMLLPRRFVRLGNREVAIQKTTTDLTVGEFTAYLEQARAWAAQELGLSFPELEFKKRDPQWQV